MRALRYSLVLLVGWVAGCAAEAAPPLVQDGAQGTTTDYRGITPVDAPPSASCEDGDWRDCRVDLPEIDGVKSCFVGVEVCVDGAWSECTTPKKAERLYQEGK